ncbi:hypothetical protein C0W93_04435 [Photobacterium leiognathi subsp. mandapamensis]|uniref:Fimbrial-type adhesion domain-containing protein n=1 Tax=Photobacterium leiognathi subsp. mandapamensis TaxID=48408 RepID=A0A2T3KYT3_PHOLD|nr:hypothetical protein C0W93_04435 [Photobacterium leiognathi subsp. mandapamensis]
MLLKVLFLQQRHLRLNIYKMKKILLCICLFISCPVLASNIINHSDEQLGAIPLHIDPSANFAALKGKPINGVYSYTQSTLDDPTFKCSNNDKCIVKGYLAQLLGVAVPGISYVDDEGNSHAVYPTNVTGIGFSVSAIDEKTGTYKPLQANTPLVTHEGATSKLAFSVRLIYIYTGDPISAGSHIISGLPNFDEVARLYADTSDSKNENVPVIIGKGDVIVNAHSCEISSEKEFTLDLGEHNINEFPSVGSLAEGKSLSVRLSCKNETVVSAVMTDQSSPGNTSNTLTLTDTSTAKGVGIQFFHKDDPKAIVYGPDNNTADQSNKWYIATADKDEDLIDVNFTAKYVRTGDITAGEASGIASVTFIYE